MPSFASRVLPKEAKRRLVVTCRLLGEPGDPRRDDVGAAAHPRLVEPREVLEAGA